MNKRTLEIEKINPAEVRGDDYVPLSDAEARMLEKMTPEKRQAWLDRVLTRRTAKVGSPPLPSRRRRFKERR